MRRSFFAITAVVCAFGACAKGLPLVEDAGGIDATVDGSGCPQFDTTKDPQHCGSCTNVCEAGLVCSSSKCQSSCQSPTTKCTTDAGAVCASLASDPDHCGQCTTACELADAGGMALGTGNPSPNVPFDGGYDGGPGWSLGSPACEAGACNVACPSGMTKCNDDICYDTQNHHDHCGACSTACASGEWCGSGHCCAQGTEWCGSACVDVLTDSNNCGSCGHACSGGTPYCSAGTCVAGCVPTGSRQPFNTLSSSTVTGCWTGNPCGTDTYNFSQTNGVNYQAVGENIVCGGTTACVGHVGINTYSGSTTICQGTWDIYCDGTKVGSIATTGKTCTGTAMTNGCSTSFTPKSCSSIKVQLSAGSGTDLCCDTSGTGPDSMIVGVSAW